MPRTVATCELNVLLDLKYFHWPFLYYYHVFGNLVSTNTQLMNTSIEYFLCSGCGSSCVWQLGE